MSMLAVRPVLSDERCAALPLPLSFPLPLSPSALGFVRWEARRISARACPSLGRADREELVAAGYLGLSQAAARYDRTARVPFELYCKKRVRGAMYDWLRWERKHRRLLQPATLDGIAK